MDEMVDSHDLDDHLVQYYDNLRIDFPDEDFFHQRHVHKLQLLQLTLALDDCIKSVINCLDCGRRLEWMRPTADNTEMFFKCIHCVRAPNLLRFDPIESADQLKNLLATENMQLVAAALHLAHNSSRHVPFPLSLPLTPDNPVDILCSYNEKIPNGFKFGGGDKAIVIADLYRIPNCPRYGVLIVSDTEMVPTRYYLHALDFGVDHNKGNKLIGEHVLNELAIVGNMVVKAGSILVLGPTLQYLIGVEGYAKERHNLKLIVPFNVLAILDSTNATLNVAQNFKQILGDAVTICEVIRRIFEFDVREVAANEIAQTDTSLLQKLQLYLTAAIWMRFFPVTPFNNFLYHCIKDTWTTFIR